MDDVSPEPEVGLEHVHPRDSSLRIDVTISVGYQRQRGGTTDRWEARISTVGLLLVGAAVTLLVLFVLLPRILAAL